MTVSRHAALLLVLAFTATLATACGFSGSSGVRECGPTNSPDWISCMLNRAPYRTPDSDSRKTVYETPGLIRVQHGRSCTAAPSATDGQTIGFRVQQQATVPLTLADSGTVFMNGWELRYTQGDHHVQGLGSAVINIRSTRSASDLLLEWDAGGVLTDQNGDDPYEWCYSYTIVFWSRAAQGFDMSENGPGLGFMQTTGSDPGNDSALRSIRGSGTNSYGQGAVLPKGFALMWGGESDRHVLQLGLDYGQHLSTSSSELAWTSRTVLKDNDRRNDYYGGELVSILSYASPKSWHPQQVLRQTPMGDWTLVDNNVPLAPRAAESNCIGVGDPTGESHYKVLNVPFQYAVPMLKGWELGYLCSDHHVRELGASVKDFRYERDAYSDTGTLYYTLSMKLGDDDRNVNYASASVDILGLNARGPAPHPLNGPNVAPPPPAAPLGCSFASLSLADGQAITAYRVSRSALCEPCEAETRVCSNGMLSGSYAASSCTPTRPGRGQACP